MAESKKVLYPLVPREITEQGQQVLRKGQQFRLINGRLVPKEMISKK